MENKISTITVSPNHLFKVGDTLLITRLDDRWWKKLLNRLLRRPLPTIESKYVIETVEGITMTISREKELYDRNRINSKASQAN